MYMPVTERKGEPENSSVNFGGETVRVIYHEDGLGALSCRSKANCGYIT